MRQTLRSKQQKNISKAFCPSPGKQ